MPNEYDGTCGDKASFGQIVCPKGADCNAKPGAYPFIAALGTGNNRYEQILGALSS